MKILISVLLNMPRVVALEVKRNGVNEGTVSYSKILKGVTWMCYVLQGVPYLCSILGLRKRAYVWRQSKSEGSALS